MDEEDKNISQPEQSVEPAVEGPVDDWRNKPENQQYINSATSVQMGTPKKSGKGKIIAFIVVLLLLIGGGVAAFFILQNNNNQKDNSSKDKNNNAQEQKVDDNQDSPDIAIDKISGGDVLTLADHGIQITLPSDSATPFRYDGNTLILWHAKVDGQQYWPGFAKPDENPSGMAAVHFSAIESDDINYEKIGKVNNTYIYAEFPNGLPELNGSDEQQWYQDSRKVLDAFVKNADNYKQIKAGGGDILTLADHDIKISLPADSTTPFSYDGNTLVLWYAKADGQQYWPGFASPDRNPSGMVAVHFEVAESKNEGYVKIGKVGNTIIYIEAPNGFPKFDGDDEQEWYSQSSQVLQAYVGNIKNYESIK